MSHDAVGRLLATEFVDNYRYGTFENDAEPRWYRRHGSTWVSQDVERHLRDCYQSLRIQLIARACADCFPAEGKRRLAFIEQRCQTASAMNEALATAALYIGAPG